MQTKGSTFVRQLAPVKPTTYTARKPIFREKPQNLQNARLAKEGASPQLATASPPNIKDSHWLWKTLSNLHAKKSQRPLCQICVAKKGTFALHCYYGNGTAGKQFAGNHFTSPCNTALTSKPSWLQSRILAFQFQNTSAYAITSCLSRNKINACNGWLKNKILDQLGLCRKIPRDH